MTLWGYIELTMSEIKTRNGPSPYNIGITLVPDDKFYLMIKKRINNRMSYVIAYVII